MARVTSGGRRPRWPKRGLACSGLGGGGGGGGVGALRGADGVVDAALLDDVVESWEGVGDAERGVEVVGGEFEREAGDERVAGDGLELGEVGGVGCGGVGLVDDLEASVDGVVRVAREVEVGRRDAVVVAKREAEAEVVGVRRDGGRVGRVKVDVVRSGVDGAVREEGGRGDVPRDEGGLLVGGESLAVAAAELDGDAEIARQHDVVAERVERLVAVPVDLGRVVLRGPDPAGGVARDDEDWRVGEREASDRDAEQRQSSRVREAPRLDGEVDVAQGPREGGREPVYREVALRVAADGLEVRLVRLERRVRRRLSRHARDDA
mmetsp:Transcript_20861/g.65655  ORF Transcript_20861/g.65655 Transcript_20861/m.65655 type:complete len:322 (+) Transcript_20861:697-1662(+)